MVQNIFLALSWIIVELKIYVSYILSYKNWVQYLINMEKLNIRYSETNN